MSQHLMRTLVPAAILLFCMKTSHAALGGPPFDPDSDKDEAAAVSVQSTNRPTHTEILTRLSSGTQVREYVSGGKVFAVSWSGPFLPDLQALLGTYFDAMVAESSKKPRAGRSQLKLNSSDVVIQSGGHMGAFEGRAWLPGKLPAGFQVGDIK